MQASFLVSDGIDGSPLFYNITLLASSTSCGSAEINASSCRDGICNYEFEVTSTSCSPSTDISVTVFASNVLGIGEASQTFVG